MEAERKSGIHPLMAGAAAAEKAPEPAQRPMSKAPPQKSTSTAAANAAPTWRSGDRVRVVDGKIEPRI